MSEPITIALVGDVYLGPDLPENIGPAVQEIFDRADLVVANQEGPVCTANDWHADKCCLRSDPQAADRLAAWGVDVVSLANNHMFDYGVAGFEQTRRELDRVGIRYCGAGMNLAEASQPLVVEVGGLKIGFLAFSWSVVQTTCATDDSPGCAPLDDELMVKSVRDLAPAVDLLIVMPHWGFCDYVFPTPEHVGSAQRLLAGGADAVVGSHNHVLQGLKADDDGLVLFGLGDFAFAPFTFKGRQSEFSRDNRESGILTLRIADGRIESHSMDFTVRTNGLIVLDASDRRCRRFTRRSEPLARVNYQRHWRRVVRRRMAKRLLYWANILNWRKIQKETFVGFVVMLKNMVVGRSGK